MDRACKIFFSQQLQAALPSQLLPDPLTPCEPSVLKQGSWVGISCFLKARN